MHSTRMVRHAPVRTCAAIGEASAGPLVSYLWERVREKKHDANRHVPLTPLLPVK